MTAHSAGARRAIMSVLAVSVVWADQAQQTLDRRSNKRKV